MWLILRKGNVAMEIIEEFFSEKLVARIHRFGVVCVCPKNVVSVIACCCDRFILVFEVFSN